MKERHVKVKELKVYSRWNRKATAFRAELRGEGDKPYKQPHSSKGVEKSVRCTLHYHFGDNRVEFPWRPKAKGAEVECKSATKNPKRGWDGTCWIWGIEFRYHISS
jgi:hypothetical protein